MSNIRTFSMSEAISLLGGFDVIDWNRFVYRNIDHDLIQRAASLFQNASDTDSSWMNVLRHIRYAPEGEIREYYISGRIAPGLQEDPEVTDEGWMTLHFTPNETYLNLRGRKFDVKSSAIGILTRNISPDLFLQIQTLLAEL